MLKIRALTLIVVSSLAAVAPLGRATMIVYDPPNHVTGTLQLQQQELRVAHDQLQENARTTNDPAQPV